MVEVIHSLTSTNGRYCVEVVRRPTGGYQLVFSQYIEEHVPGCGLVSEGWAPMNERITLADTAERGIALAAEAMALWERQQMPTDSTMRPDDVT